MSLDIVLDPVEPGASERARTPAASVRVYESSLPGLTSLVLFDDRGMLGGTRLTREQVVDLHRALGEHLGASS